MNTTLYSSVILKRPVSKLFPIEYTYHDTKEQQTSLIINFN